ncbi:MAG TPA: MoaD/ThiS family protein [Terriglobales bacterium]|nr:MoaD/ThiS family protein [Terriglobales bacterium]
MAVIIRIPTPLRPLTGGLGEIETQAGSVSEALAALTSRYAEVGNHLFTGEGRLRSFVNVYVNDEDIRYLQSDRTPLRDGDTLSIVPSIAGGVA